MSEMTTAEMVVAKLLHDISTPLSSIGLNLDTLGACREEHRAKVLRRAQTNLEVVWATIQKWRVFIQARGRKLPFAIADATVKAVDTCKQGFEQGFPVTVTVEVVSDFQVVGSPELWDGLTQNLLSNAIRAVIRNHKHNAHTVQIKIERIDDNRGTVTFTDSGVGMATEELSRFWEPSFTTQESGSWHGLGKLIVKDALEFHAGRVSITSSPGVGTTFVVTLPVAPSGWESTLVR